MSEDIGALVERLLEEHGDLNEGRANELRTELKGALNAIANRIDRGYSVEIRAGELPEETDEEPEDPIAPDVRDITATVLSMQQRLAYTNVTGKPILWLPEQAAADTEM